MITNWLILLYLDGVFAAIYLAMEGYRLGQRGYFIHLFCSTWVSIFWPLVSVFFLFVKFFRWL